MLPYPKLTLPATRYHHSTMSRPMMNRSAATAAPRMEPKPDINPLTGKPDWSRYNATVVGNVPVVGAAANPGFPPGLEATQGPNARPPPYRMVSFGGREYANDEDGWQRVVRAKNRKWRGMHDDE